MPIQIDAIGPWALGVIGLVAGAVGLYGSKVRAEVIKTQTDELTGIKIAQATTAERLDTVCRKLDQLLLLNDRVVILEAMSRVARKS